MMEKYGVSYDDVPPTDEQYRELKKLSMQKGIEYVAPATSKEAMERIEEMSK